VLGGDVVKVAVQRAPQRRGYRGVAGQRQADQECQANCAGPKRHDAKPVRTAGEPDVGAFPTPEV
jgi:hypothetical protein